MNLTGNTILITGGGSGIGRGLAESLHALGNQVIVAGRRQHALDETTAANPGMKSLRLDIENAAAIRDFAAKAVAEFPSLNVLINNAGIMRAKICSPSSPTLPTPRPWSPPISLAPSASPRRCCRSLLKQSHAAIINVSSGLAFLPLAITPTYCATKAAIHSYTLSLRYQLRNTAIEVLELIPPYVQTDLMDGNANDPRAMPLDQFITEVMGSSSSSPPRPKSASKTSSACALPPNPESSTRSSTASTPRRQIVTNEHGEQVVPIAMELSSRVPNIKCHPERDWAHLMRPGESKDLRLLLPSFFPSGAGREPWFSIPYFLPSCSLAPSLPRSLAPCLSRLDTSPTPSYRVIC